MAWGARPGEEPAFVDPHGGRDDLARRLLRAVGDPDGGSARTPCAWPRAVRLAARWTSRSSPRPTPPSVATPTLASHLSGERICAELLKLLAAGRPSIGLRLMADSGLLAVMAPDLARQRGIGQNKIAGEDLWDHTLRTVDAPRTGSSSGWRRCCTTSANPTPSPTATSTATNRSAPTMARDFLAASTPPEPCRSEWRIWCATTCSRTTELDRRGRAALHPQSRAGVHRRSCWPCARPTTRAAANPPTGHLAELAARVGAELAANVVLGESSWRSTATTSWPSSACRPGRLLGRLLEDLTERVVAEPALNDRAILLDMARQAMISIATW
jgi:hypothetical protein